MPERAIFHGEAPDSRTAILIGIASPSGLLGNVFEKRELKERKDRIDEIAATAHPADVTGQAVKVAIEAAVAAVMTATMAATVASSAGA